MGAVKGFVNLARFSFYGPRGANLDSLRFFDPVESLLRTDKERLTEGGETCHVGRSVNLVFRDWIEGLARLHDMSNSITIAQVNQAHGVGGRGTELPIEPFPPMKASGFGVKAREDSSIVHGIDFFTN